MQYNFIRSRFLTYGITLFLLVVSVASAAFLHLNLGIDMTGGMTLEYQFSPKTDRQAAFKALTIDTAVEQAKAVATASGKTIINTFTAFMVSGEDSFIVETGFDRPKDLSDADFDKLKTAFREDVTKLLQARDGSVKLVNYANIGESFSDYIKKTAYLTLALIVVGISFYIAFAFRGAMEGVSSFSFAFVTAMSLIHDVVITFGLYLIASAIFPEFKVDTYFITAMLTVLGYSINDTIVIMDRIRSNLKLQENRKLSFDVLVNTSLTETMRRSLYTSFTIVIVLIAMFAFGPESLRGFTLALIIGTIIGTYSSIFIAAPLLYDIHPKNK